MQENKPKFFNRLSVRYTALLAASVVAGLIAGILIISAGNAFVNGFYNKENRQRARTEELFDLFDAYVAKEHISCRDIQSITDWSPDPRYITLFVRSEASNIFGGFRPDQYVMGAYTVKTIQFYDGSVQIGLIDNSDDYILLFIKRIGIFVGFLTIALINISYYFKLLRRIDALGEEIELVNSGELNRQIPVSGDDELSALALHAENMRRSIIAHYEKEQKAYKSNTELVTAISHDIRTPLTTLLLYTDALSEGKVDAELTQKYAKICSQKAKQLKELTDTMFRYFLLFGKNSSANIEAFNASELIMQLVGEHTFMLSQDGYNVPEIFMEKECVIKADAQLLKRVFDNIFSNIRKYADKSKPISITINCDTDFLHISVINYILHRSDKSQSTGIGLKSSQRIIETMGGAFKCWQSNGVYEALVSIPQGTRPLTPHGE